MQAGGEVDAAVFGECEALGAAKSAIPGLSLAVGVDGPDGVVGVERGRGDKERAFGVDSEMVESDRGLKSRVDEDLALGIDLEDGAAAVAHKEVAFGVEGGSGGDPHALGVDRELS